MTRRRVVVLALGAVLATAVPAVASVGRTAGTLQLHAGLATTWQKGNCPAGTSSPPALCYSIQGHGVVAGLGRVTEQYTYVIDDYTAQSSSVHFAAAITVTGKGEIEATAETQAPVCPCS